MRFRFDKFAVLALGFEALAEDPDQRIMKPGDGGGPVEGVAEQGIADLGQAGMAFPFSETVLFGRETGKGGDVARFFETVNIA
jgi:hypothetical protein